MMMDVVSLNHCLFLVSRWWTLLLLLWTVGSVFDPMLDDLFGCGVGSVNQCISINSHVLLFVFVVVVNVGQLVMDWLVHLLDGSFVCFAWSRAHDQDLEFAV